MKPPPETPTIKPIERKWHMWALKRTTAAVPHADITKVSRPSWSPRSSAKNIWGSLLPTTWPMRFAHGIHLGLLHIRKVGSMTSHHTPSSHLRGTLTLHHAHVELHTSVPKPWSTRSCEMHSVSHCSQTDMHIFKTRKKNGSLSWSPTNTQRLHCHSYHSKSRWHMKTLNMVIIEGRVRGERLQLVHVITLKDSSGQIFQRQFSLNHKLGYLA